MTFLRPSPRRRRPDLGAGSRGASLPALSQALVCRRSPSPPPWHSSPSFPAGDSARRCGCRCRTRSQCRVASPLRSPPSPSSRGTPCLLPGLCSHWPACCRYRCWHRHWLPGLFGFDGGGGVEFVVAVSHAMGSIPQARPPPPLSPAPPTPPLLTIMRRRVRRRGGRRRRRRFRQIVQRLSPASPTPPLTTTMRWRLRGWCGWRRRRRSRQIVRIFGKFPTLRRIIMSLTQCAAPMLGAFTILLIFQCLCEPPRRPPAATARAAAAAEAATARSRRRNNQRGRTEHQGPARVRSGPLPPLPTKLPLSSSSAALPLLRSTAQWSEAGAACPPARRNGGAGAGRYPLPH